MIILLSALAGAGSLDAVEIGGPFASPTATDATAIWWNPGAFAAGSGTRFHAEAAPTFATIHYDRVDPYGYEGSDALGFTGVLPFVGVGSDFGVDGLGVGLSFSVPYGRAGNAKDEIRWVGDYTGDIPVTRNVGRYSTRTGSILAMNATLAAGYDFGPVSVGAGGILVLSSWDASLDNSLLPDLDHQIQELGQDPGYTDSMIEDPRYAATLDFDTLHDTAFTFNAGVQVEPIEDRLSFGLAYHHGVSVRNEGDLTLHFSCPPQEDTLGRFGSEAYGLCDASLDAGARVAYRLPSRLYGSVRFLPIEDLQLELMGGWVGWSAFQDFDIQIYGVGNRNELDNENTADLVNQERKWARANHDTFWLAVDAKGEVTDRLLVGGRVMYDPAAVPDEALMLNNFDTNQLILTGLGTFEVVEGLDVGLSFSHYLLFSRTIDNSGFGMTLDPDARNEDRWFYPHANGTYRGNIERIGIVVRGAFGERE